MLSPSSNQPQRSSGRIAVRAVSDDFAALAQIGNLGPTPEHGFLRAAWSAEESAAMEYFRTQATQHGFSSRYDGIGNLYLRIPGNWDSVVMVGSHLDTVPEGGNYDGAAGIVAGFQALRSLSCDPNLKRGLELVIWRGEESGTFGAVYMGSRAAFGINDKNILERTFRDRTLAEAIAGQSNPINGVAFDPQLIAQQRPALDARTVDGIAAYLELHIEQGNLLEKREVDIGVVTSIRGASRWKITLDAPDDRCVAKLLVELDDMCAQALAQGLDLVQTVGVINIDCAPAKERLAKCGVSTIAGYAELRTGLSHEQVQNVLQTVLDTLPVQIEYSNADPGGTLLRINGKFDHSGATPMGLEYRSDANLAAARIGALLYESFPNVPLFINRQDGQHCSFMFEVRGDNQLGRDVYVRSAIDHIDRSLSDAVNGPLIGPISVGRPLEAVDPHIKENIRQAAQQLGYQAILMPSGAGHDAAVVAEQRRSDGSLIPVGMIFVPCRDGLSHCKQEYASAEAVTKGAEVLAETLYRLAVASDS